MRRDFGMFSKTGNQKVENLVLRALRKKYSLSLSESNKELYDFLKVEMKKISMIYPEIYDTEVRSSIIAEIEEYTGRDLTIYF